MPAPHSPLLSAVKSEALHERAVAHASAFPSLGGEDGVVPGGAAWARELWAELAAAQSWTRSARKAVCYAERGREGGDGGAGVVAAPPKQRGSTREPAAMVGHAPCDPTRIREGGTGVSVEIIT